MLLEVLGKFTSFICVSWLWWWDGLSENVTTRAVVTFLAASLTIYWYSLLFKKPKTNSPPGPRGLPLVGSLPFVESDLHLYFSNLSKTYGPIIKLQLGSKIYIVISSNILAKQVLRYQDAVFANRDPPAAALALSYGGLDLAWRSKSDGWRKIRKICAQELMSNTNLDASYILRRREVREMAKVVYGKVGSPINIAEQMFLTVQNVIMSMLWGEAFHGNERNKIGVELRLVIEEIVELVGKPNISDFFPSIAKLDLQGIASKMSKLCTNLDRIFDSAILDRIKADPTKSKDSKDFLQVLLMKQRDENSSFSMTELKALFMDLILAGTDTTSTTVEWAMAEILKNQEVMTKVYEELNRIIGNDKIVEESHSPKLVYLEAVIKETLRLHPVVPLLLPHTPSVSSTVGGYTIPKGSTVLFNVWDIQRDPKAWNNPEEFRPERFLEEPGKGDYKGNNFNFIPFGSGRRICAGLPLADKIMIYALATLLHSFDWKTPEGANLELSEKCSIVLKKKNPLICIPTARLFAAEQYC